MHQSYICYCSLICFFWDFRAETRCKTCDAHEGIIRKQRKDVVSHTREHSGSHYVRHYFELSRMAKEISERGIFLFRVDADKVISFRVACIE